MNIIVKRLCGISRRVGPRQDVFNVAAAVPGALAITSIIPSWSRVYWINLRLFQYEERRHGVHIEKHLLTAWLLQVTMSGVPVPPPLVSLLTTCQTAPVSTKDDCVDVCLQDLGVYTNKSITRLKPVLQTGPNCGLAALAMVATLTPNPYSIDDIFYKAKSRGFTCNGEMFSVVDMKMLAEEILAPWFSVEDFSNGLEINKCSIIKNLYEGALLLVPYDADKNHSPCCVNGHKAHWAVVCGVMEDPGGELCVAARHGKSRYLGIWLWESLVRSNANLIELDPARRDDQREYILPPGGVRAGLSNRFILLTRK